MHTIRVITRLASNARRADRASALSRLRLDYALASISCEHCRSSRNNPHYAPRHITYYYFNKTDLVKYNGCYYSMMDYI